MTPTPPVPSALRDTVSGGGIFAVGLTVMVVLGPGLQIQFTQWLVFGLLALSLSFVWGWGGIFSFGQTLFFGAAAYTYGITSQLWAEVAGGLWLALVAGVVVGCLVASVLGYLMFYGGVTDVYVAVVTLAATLVAGTLLGAMSGPSWSIGGVQLGGFNGLIGIPPLELGGQPLLGTSLNVTLLAVVAVVYLALRRYTVSNAGRVAAATADNPDRAELLGFDARLSRFTVFLLGAVVASLAGVLYAATSGIMTPAVFNVTLAGSVIIWVIFGGRSILVGGVIGAVLIGYLSDNLQYLTVAGATPFANQTPLVLGMILLLVVLLLPRGVLPALSDVFHRMVPQKQPKTVVERGDAVAGTDRRGRGRPPSWLGTGAEHAHRDASTTATRSATVRPAGFAPSADSAGSASEVIVANVTKKFGGLRAVDDVSLDIAPRTTRCLLGPNGAGKSSLFKVITGTYAATAGTISLSGRDISRLPTYRRARLGLGIKMQVPHVFPTLTVAENLWVACFAGTRNRREASELARRMTAWLALDHVVESPAGELAHGDQQWLEMGMMLSTRPSVVLLDEPTAGMTSIETAQVAELIHELYGLATIVVVEHDMEFVRMVDAPITVMVNGAVFREGSVDMLSTDQELLDVYVGRGEDAHR